MTYENMIEWAFENNIREFTEFLEEFGPDFSFLEDDFISAGGTINQKEFSLSQEKLQDNLIQEEQRSTIEPRSISSEIKQIVTSFINFFTGK